MLNRRDTRNPEGGGSEIYLETVARGLVARGHSVTIFCAAHERSGPEETIDGVRFVRAGGKLSVHREAWRLMRDGSLGQPDVIVDVQNGIPFFAPWARRGIPVIVLVHHIHREQWPVVYGPVRSRIGWFLESRIAPRLYRKCSYVAVSEDTRTELDELGIDKSRITVIHNGTEPIPNATSNPDPSPRVVVLGRLVPHKQVEHVLAGAASLRHELGGLTICVIGDGWWGPELRAAAVRYGVADIVEFRGFLSEQDKHDELSRAWLLALPSLKEGWGIGVMEAARHGVPAIGYRSAGGVAESVRTGQTGLLVEGGREEFTAGMRLLLSNPNLRGQLGEAARGHAATYSWANTVAKFESILLEQAGLPSSSLPDQRASGPVDNSEVKLAHVHHETARQELL